MTDVKLRLYCHGLGDCSLVGVPLASGKTYWILIDCGIHTSADDGPNKIAKVVADVATETGGHLDLVIGTHEHWDHLSGFFTSRDAFKDLTVGEVWLAWTEDPSNPVAMKLDKYKGDALTALSASRDQLKGVAGQEALAKGLEALLGFNFGADGDRVRQARDQLVKMGGASVRYLAPGAILPLAEQQLTAYVLGPPNDLKMLGLTDSASDTYGFGMDAGWATVQALNNAFGIQDGSVDMDDDPTAAFDDTEGAKLSALSPTDGAVYEFVQTRYGLAPAPGEQAKAAAADADWRRIDQDWFGVSAQLALQLDNRTNNTSLVIAFEIAEGGGVLVFAADAQIGNWRSWPDVHFQVGGRTVTGLDLLGRAVFYKVGHHGSANATRSTEGLEAMDSGDLLAFIPTDEVMAKKVKWGAIPADGLIKRLQDKTCGRVIRSDRLNELNGTLPKGVVAVNYQVPYVDVIMN